MERTEEGLGRRSASCARLLKNVPVDGELNQSLGEAGCADLRSGSFWRGTRATRRKYAPRQPCTWVVLPPILHKEDLIYATTSS